MPADAARTLDTVWRLESPRIIGALTRLVRDVGLAEELAQDAVVTALQEWPVTGVPPNPAGWLMLTAKHRAIDRLRRDDRLRANVALLTREAEEQQRVDAFDDPAAVDEDGVPDDVLRLVFIACHPVLAVPSRVALTLRLVGGLTTGEIARAFLVSEPTIAQRIVRAKRTLADKKIPFEVPDRTGRLARLGPVLEVVYLIFNEGHSATAGDEWLRPQMCLEALRLGRMLAELVPDEPEVHGLVALMELQTSRLGARVDADGRPVRLLDQNRGRWDQLLIRRGFTALLRARALDQPPGPYVLQAGIAACHARAHAAVAVSIAAGPEAGLRLVDGIAEHPALATYHLLPAVRADILARLGRHDEARREYLRAAALAANTRERDVLVDRAHRTS